MSERSYYRVLIDPKVERTTVQVVGSQLVIQSPDYKGAAEKLLELAETTAMKEKT